jgi:outer membrane lipoprotein-sorting protein
MMWHFAGQPRIASALVKAGLLTALAGMSATSAQAQDAKTILKRMEDLYKNAKTFQGTVTVRQQGKDQQGKAVSTTSTQQVRYLGPNKFVMDMKVTATGSIAAAAAKESRTVTCDGKNVYEYRPAIKQYAKRPIRSSVTLMELFGALMPNPDMPGISLGAPITERGRAAYLVLIKLAPPPNLPPEQKKQAEALLKTMKPVQVVIDKQNFQLLRLTSGNAQGSREVVMEGQQFGGAIPASVFNFTPPPGSKEFVPPPPVPNPGGTPQPGGPGR